MNKKTVNIYYLLQQKGTKNSVRCCLHVLVIVGYTSVIMTIMHLFKETLNQNN